MTDFLEEVCSKMKEKYKNLFMDLELNTELSEGKRIYKLKVFLNFTEILEVSDCRVIKILYDVVKSSKELGYQLKFDILEIVYPEGKVSYSMYDSQKISNKLQKILEYKEKIKKSADKCIISCYLPEFFEEWHLKNFFSDKKFPSYEVGVCGKCIKKVIELCKDLELLPVQGHIQLREELEHIPFREPPFLRGEKELILEKEFEYFKCRVYKILEDIGGYKLERSLKYVEFDIPIDEIQKGVIEAVNSKSVDAILEATLGSDIARTRNLLISAIERLGVDSKIAKGVADWLLGIQFWYDVLQWNEVKELIIRSGTQSSHLILKKYGKCLMNWNPSDRDLEMFASWASRATFGIRDWNTHKLELSLTPEHHKVPFTCRMTFLKPPHSIGYTLLVRMQEEERLGFCDLILHGTCSVEEFAYVLMFSIRPYADITFIGGVGSGKTVSQFCVRSFIPQFSITEMIGDIFEGRDPALDGRLTYYLVTDRSKEVMEVGVTRDKAIESSLRSRAETSEITEVISPDDTYAWIYSRLCNRAGSTTYHAKNRFEFLKRIYIDLTSKGLVNAGELICGALQMLIECIASLDRSNPSKYAYRWGAVSIVGSELWGKEGGEMKLPILYDLWIYDPIGDRHLKAYELPSNHPSYMPKEEWERAAFLENRHLIELQRAFPVPIHQIYNPDNPELCEYGVWKKFVEILVERERLRRNNPELKDNEDLRITSNVEVQLAYRIVELILNNINKYNVEFSKKFKEVVEKLKEERIMELEKIGLEAKLSPEDIEDIEKKALEDCKKIYEPFWEFILKSMESYVTSIIYNPEQLKKFKEQYCGVKNA